MARIENTPGTGAENQAVGKVFILYGTVTAIAEDGTVRALAPNSPIFANEHIITESDGSVSIQFDGPPVTQLDLGRMTEIIIDEDVYAGVAPEVVSEAAAESEQIQDALLEGDQPIDLEATAAGGSTGAGGGHSVVNFALTGEEVTPGSGADTTGVTTNPVNTLGGVFDETGGSGAMNTPPIATDNTNIIYEDATRAVSGNMITDNSGFGVDSDVDAGATLTVSAVDATGANQYGTLTWNADGSYSYAINNSLPAVQALNVEDRLEETYTYTLTDENGATDTATLTIFISGRNDAPIATANMNTIAEDATSAATGNMIADNDGFGVDSDIDNGATLTVSAVDATGANKYGTLTWSEDGSYSYAIDNSLAAVQALDAGDTVTEIYTYTLTDENGRSDTATLTITINGTEDAPTVSGDVIGSVQEDLTPSASGTIAVADVDQGDIYSFAAGDQDSPNGLGTFSIDAQGHWTYTLNNEAAQSLDSDSKVTESYTVTASVPGEGEPVTQVVTITINGTEDAPTVSGDVIGSVQEDLTPSASGTIAVADVDQGDIYSFAAGDQDSPNGLGTFSIDAQGHWTYTLNNEAAQSLDSDSKVTESYTVTASVPGEGEPVTQVVTITINGTEDAPTVSGDVIGSVQEDLTPSASGTIAVADVDQGDIYSFAAGDQDSPNGLGTFSIDAQGHWTYTLNNEAAQSLDSDSKVTESYTVTASVPGEGEPVTQVVTITINGTEDAPTVSGDVIGSVQEDLTPSASGTIAVADVDQGDIYSFAAGDQDSPNGLGTFSIDAQGHWTYTLNNEAAQSLDSDSKVTESYTVTASVPGEGEPVTQVVTITINGTEDAPTVSGDVIGSVQEDLTPSASGTIAVADVDQGDIYSFAAGDQDSPNGLGTFSIDAQGHWTYTLNNEAAQSLDSDSKVTESYTVTASVPGEGEPVTQVVTITINGTEDAPTVSGDVIGSVQEDLTPSASGTIAVADVDQGDIYSFAAGDQDSPNGLGTFSIDAQGHWTYTLNNEAAQSLDSDSKVTESYTVTASVPGEGEPVTQVVTITINGTEDAPTVSGDVIGSVQEDLTPSASGTIAVADVDQGDIYSFAAGDQDSPNGLGTFSIDAQGHWTYTLNNEAAQSLDSDSKVTESYTVTASVPGEGEPVTQVVTITINGTEDAPTVSGDVIGSVQEDLTPSASGTIAVADVDQGDIYSFAAGDQDSPNGLGTFSIDAQGHWTYTLNNEAAQSLDSDSKVTESYTVTASVPGEGEPVTQVVTITINGTEDAPTVSGDVIGSVQEDLTPSASGTIAVADVDQGDIYSFAAGDQDSPNGLGTFSIDAQGHWTYTLNNEAAQSLDSDSKVTESYTVTASVPGEGEPVTQVVTITINGTEDAPTVSGDVIGSVQEDLTPSASGTIAVADVDQGDIYSFAAGDQDSPNGLGTFSIDAQGHWTYTLNNEAAQSLDSDSKVTESYTVTASVPGEGEPVTQVVTITINGTEDAPTVSGDVIGSVQEDLTPSASGTIAVADVDQGDIYSFAAGDQDSPNGLGTFSIDAQGHWTYTLNNEAAQSLDSDSKVTESYTVTASVPGEGEPVTQVVTITINGTEDAPTVSGDVIGSVQEDLTPSASGTIAVADVDQGDIYSFAAGDQDSPNGLGTFSIDAQGHWTYTLNNEAAQSLDSDSKVTESYTVTASVPGEGEPVTQVVTITINGTEDAPTVSGDVIGSVQEDLTPSASGTIAVADVDQGDIYSFAAGDQDSPNGLGTFSIDAQGHWTYTLNNEAAQSLDSDSKVTESYTVTASVPGEGEPVTQVVTITINGTEDAPTVSGDVIGSVQEDLTPSASGTIAVADVDQGDIYSFAAGDQDSPNGLGTFSIDAQGHWTYTLNNEAAQSLDSDSKVTESYTVTASVPGEGEPVTQVVTITINGTEDAPTVSGDVIGSVQEDLTPSASGTIAVADVDQGDIYSFAAGDQDSPNGLGTFSIDAQGHWTYTLNNEAAQSLDSDSKVTESYTVTASVPGEGEPVTQVVTITINGTEDGDVPVAGETHAYVDDEGLSGGIPGGTNDIVVTPDADHNEATFNGTLAFNFGSDGAGSVTFAGMDGTTGSVGTEEVAYAWDSGTNTLTATVSGGARDGVDLFTVEVTDSISGAYTVTLLDNVLHEAGGNENNAEAGLTYTVTDSDGSTAAGTLNVTFNDDTPTAVDINSNQHVSSANTNLMIILDDSGSMDDWAYDSQGHHMVDSQGHDMTKLDVAKESIGQLFDAYDAQGDVMVKLVAFNTSASEVGDTGHWMTIDQATTALANLQASGNTNYDAALSTAMSAFGDPGNIDGAQNVSYFLSDGEPNRPSGHAGIDGYGAGNSDVSVNEWTSFVDGHNIVSFALGMGSSAKQAALDPIAYNGVEPADTHAIVVDQWSDLGQALVNTLHALPVSGALGSVSAESSNFGADGGHVQSITVDGHTYTYNPAGEGSITETGGPDGGHSAFDTATNELTVTFLDESHGKIAVDMDNGKFIYTPPAVITGNVHETVGFTLVDGDGDTASASLNMLIDDPTDNP